MGSHDCFFYLQTCFRETPKRYRKLPEDLPESLKFAHLNPKVAALLASKEKQKQDEMVEMLEKKDMVEINQTFQQIKNHFDLDKFFNDDDTQRYLYEEAKYNAGNVLDQLARYVYRFQNIAKVIPKSLESEILSSYQDLVADVFYMPREWQTQAIREPTSKNSDSNVTDDTTVIDEEVRPTKMLSEVKPKKKSGTKIGLPYITEDDRKTDKNRLPQTKHGAESKPSLTLAKSRLDKGKFNLHAEKVRNFVRSPNLKRGTIYEGEKSSHGGSPTESRAYGNPHYMSVIHFELSSKTCEDKGWIKQKGDGQGINREKLLEWCIQILQQSLKTITEQEKYDKGQGLDKPVQVRYYGDTRMDTLIKYRKSPTKIEFNPALRGQKPRIPSIDNDRNEGKSLMLSGHTDGTTVVYYPSGRPAVIYSAAGYGHPGYYTIAYDDKAEMKMLACFTPTGRGCVYHSNGVIRFLATSTGGHVADKHGCVNRKWKWPSANVKITNPVSLQLNSSLGFRCIALSQMALYYNNEKESAKFLVSPISGTSDDNYGEEYESHLLTTFNFTSNAAKELLKIFNPRKQKKKKKDKNKGTLIEVHKLLDFPEVTMYGTQDEKDLAKLQRKAKNLIDDWLEHYRIAVGFSLPSLNSIQDQPPSRRRYSQSAKLSNKDFMTRGATLGIGEQTAVKASRTPSAPSSQSLRPSLSLPPCDQNGQTSSEMFNEVTVSVEATGDGQPMSPSAVAVFNRLISVSSPTRSKSSKSRRCRPKSSARQPLQLLPLDNVLSYSSCENCPQVLRHRLMGQSSVYCRCSRHHIPSITDFEFDDFLCKVAPNAQLQVVVIVSSLFPKCNLAVDMLEKMYGGVNRNRMRPCSEGRGDTERFLKYDINTSAENSNHTQPLLLTRHNAVPGMILIYADNNLLFCDHIFNGYGYTKKDFKKQVNKSRLDAIHGVFLPRDFKFSPSRGHHGPRSAWGGDIGGAGVDSYGSPGMTRDLVSQESSLSLDDRPATQFKTFQYGLNYLMDLSTTSSEFLPSVYKRNGCSSLHLYESLSHRATTTCRTTQSQPSYSCKVTSASIS